MCRSLAYGSGVANEAGDMDLKLQHPRLDLRQPPQRPVLGPTEVPVVIGTAFSATLCCINRRRRSVVGGAGGVRGVRAESQMKLKTAGLKHQQLPDWSRSTAKTMLCTMQAPNPACI